jgi:imidazolonepropionase-like amidohydrolase
MRMWGILFLVASSLAAQTVALKVGHLIDPATGGVADRQVVLVKDGKITGVGAALPIPAGAEVVDLSEAWVMPGIMDAHTHVTFGAPEWKEMGAANYVREGTGFRALRGLHTAQVLLRAGITTVRDIGNEANYAGVDLRRALGAGWFEGPTIQSAGKIIGPTGGQLGGLTFEAGPVWQFEYLDANSPDEVRKAVRQNLYYGANVIKLVSDSNRYFYSLAEIQAGVEEAHRAGVALAVHVMGGEAARNVILGGADSIEHGFYLSDELLKLMKEKGTFLVGTDFPEAHFLAGGGFPGGKEDAAAILDRLRRAYRIGVKMGFATDIVIDMPGKTRADMTWDYLAVWRAAGIPNAHVLKCMTTWNAELLRIQDQRGAIRPGLWADVIAMPKNPLEDTEALRGVNFVMKNGKVIRRP